MTTILSVIASSIIAFFIAKWQMKKNKIVHFTINSYDIGKGLSEEFPKLKLHYDQDILAENVMVFKGGFMNTGRNDIDGLKGGNDIKLIFPDECKIKDFKISTSTEDLLVTSNKECENDNILNFGISEIFKTDEYFKYTAIIETTKKIESLHSELKFHHRISNTDKIGNTYIGLQANQSRKRFYKMSTIYVIVLTLLTLFIISYQRLDFTIYKKANNQEVEIYIDPNSNLYINEGFSIPFINDTKISLDEFEKEYKIVPLTKFKWNSSNNLAFIIPVAIAILIYLLAYYVTWGRNGHILNVLKENEENENHNKKNKKKL